MAEKHERLKELTIDRADIESTRSGGGFALALIAVLLVTIAIGAFFWFTRSQAVVVETATVERIDPGSARTAATVLDASGYVTARRQATVSSKITGKIVEVLIEEGLVVDEGQVLARLDDALPKRQLDLAEAELEAAKKSLVESEVRLTKAELDRKRLARLVEADVASQDELDAAEADVDALEARLDLGREEIEVAERRLELRRQELEDTIIRAPFDGVVVTKDAQPGEMISPVSAGGGFTRTGIGTVVDMGSLEIEVDVNEAYIGRVAAGQPVEAVLDAYPDWTIPARVITPVPTADRQKATVRVRIGFDELDSRILPDMGVKVSFLDEGEPASLEATEPTSASPRLVAPKAALFRDGDDAVAFVVRGGVLERRAIRVGETRDGRLEILAGLEAGETVVVGVVGGEKNRLADGLAIEIQDD